MADRYFVNGGVDNNWGTTGNWSTTSGGSGGASIPTAADAVFFDANSPNVTVNATNRVCLSLNFTGYTNTITMTFGITSSGSVTLSSAMTIAGSASLAVNAAATLTSNGKTWPNALVLQSASNVVYTFGDNWVCNGLVTVGYGSQYPAYNGSQIICNGGFTNATTNGEISGTTKFILAGGTITSSSSFTPGMSLNFDYAGNITFASGTFWNVKGGATHTYVSGSVTFSGSHTLSIYGSCTFNTGSSIIWKAISFNVTSTLTLTTPIYCNATLTLGGGNQTFTINGTIFAGQNLSYNSSANTYVTGTGQIVMNGTGTISQGGGVSTGSFPLIIDTTGDITISSKFYWDLTKIVFRNVRSVTTSELWRVGSGGGFRPVNIRGGADQ